MLRIDSKMWEPYLKNIKEFYIEFRFWTNKEHSLFLEKIMKKILFIDLITSFWLIFKMSSSTKDKAFIKEFSNNLFLNILFWYGFIKENLRRIGGL